MRAQEVAMGALNLPSASDLERLTRRVRSVSQRLEGIEDALDRLDERLGRAAGNRALEERLDRIEASLGRLEKASAGPRPAPRAKRAGPKT
jgi:predicted  nucleic acid-binding Zn-ribbon protein